MFGWECGRKRWMTAVAVTLGLAAAALGLYQGNRQASLQQSIAGEVIRFHILANSDSQEDQELKLAVRDEVLASLEELLEGSSGVDDSRERIREHLDEIQAEAQQYVREEMCIRDRGLTGLILWWNPAIRR